MAALTSLAPQIAAEVPGASPPLLLVRIRAVARDFCERTRLWRSDLAAIDVEDYRTAQSPKDVGVYDLAVGAGEQIVGVMVAQHDDRELDATSESALDTDWPRLLPRWGYRVSPWGERKDWRTLDDSDPLAYYQPKRSQIRLVPLPTADLTGGLKVNVALKPGPTGSTIDDDVYNDWYEALAAGVLASMFRSPQSKWYDLKAALERSAAYENAVNEARGSQVRSHARPDRTTGRVRSWM